MRPSDSLREPARPVSRAPARLSIPRQVLRGALRFLLALVPLCLALNGAGDAFRVVDVVRASERDEAGQTAARVVVGPLVSAPRLSPLHALPMVLAARIGHASGAPKSRHFSTDCFITSVDGLIVEDQKTHERFTVSGFEGKTAAFRSGFALAEPRSVTVDFPESSGTLYGNASMPATMLEWCRGRVPSTSNPEYVERDAKVGDVITVRGCPVPDAPNVLRPCLDGRDIITSRSLAGARAATKDEQAGTMLTGGAALLVGVVLLGVLARHARVMSRPEGQPDLPLPWERRS
ncbi:MAG: hypothetical protein JWP97_363 [Labilithrix sp.]|nr:hypothetical protein [Labilithrix sp.]